MSVKVMTTILYHVHNVTPTEKMILIAIAENANEKGWAYPGIELIASKAEVSPRTVTNLIQSLEEKGELIVERNWGPHGTNRYGLSCITKGVYNPPDKAEIFEPEPAEAASGGGANVSPLKELHPPERIAPPLKSLGNDGSPLKELQGGANVSPCNLESKISPEPSGRDKKERKREAPSFPSTVEDVLAAAFEYPGNPARGIPARIDEAFAREHFAYRMKEGKGVWDIDWRRVFWKLYEKIYTESRRPQAAFAGTQACTGTAEGVSRPRWQIERDLKLVEKQMDEHPVQWLAANEPLTTSQKETWEGLKVKHKKVKKELEEAHD